MDSSSTALALAVPASARRVGCALERAGFECYAVGGCVRDALRGIMPADWDFTTDATVDAMKAAFDASAIRWRATGERHGTLTALVDDVAFEVTTYRIDGAYSDGRHPDAVTFTRSLDEDLARRDFTINAMAWSETSGLVDCFGGRRDLAAGIIRAVGDPTVRFTEDALRILRALRFAATLGFEIEPATAAAMHRCAELIEALSRERVFTELDRMLGASDGVHLAAIVRTFFEVIAIALGGYTTPTLAEESVAALAFTPADPAVRWTVLLAGADSPANASATLRRLRAPKRLIRTVDALSAFKTRPLPADRIALRRMLVACGSLETFERIIAIRRAEDLARDDKRADQSPIFDRLLVRAEDEIEGGLPLTVGALTVHGEDLIDRGMAPGPAVGATLRRLFDAVIDLELPNDRTALLSALNEV